MYINMKLIILLKRNIKCDVLPFEKEFCIYLKVEKIRKHKHHLGI